MKRKSKNKGTKKELSINKDAQAKEEAFLGSKQAEPIPNETATDLVRHDGPMVTHFML